MADASSPPIPIADSTPWEAPIGGDAFTYEIRFYAGAAAEGELAQGGGRTVTIEVKDRVRYPGAITEHTSTLANYPPVLVPGGEWQLVGLGLGGFSSVRFVAVQGTEPPDATHYRIRVKWR